MRIVYLILRFGALYIGFLELEESAHLIVKPSWIKAWYSFDWFVGSYWFWMPYTILCPFCWLVWSLDALGVLLVLGFSKGFWIWGLDLGPILNNIVPKLSTCCTRWGLSLDCFDRQQHLDFDKLHILFILHIYVWRLLTCL